MFGNGTKKENQRETASVVTSSNSINSLGTGTKVEGTLSAESDIRIDGELIGNLYCKGKLIVGPQGRIEGEIRCKNALIEGRFTGKLEVDELLNVRESAKINGDIRTSQLVVQSGAVFNVSCAMGKEKAKKQSPSNGKEEAVLTFATKT